MSEHTPGPWKWGWRLGDEVNPGSVVSVGYPNAPERPFSVAMCPRYRGPTHHHRWDADARLIAAAPDLLEALEALVDGEARSLFVVRSTEVEAALERARSAIAKARGDA